MSSARAVLCRAGRGGARRGWAGGRLWCAVCVCGVWGMYVGGCVVGGRLPLLVLLLSSSPSLLLAVVCGLGRWWAAQAWGATAHAMLTILQRASSGRIGVS